MVKLNINGISVEMTVSELKEYLSEDKKEIYNVTLKTLKEAPTDLKRMKPYTLTELRMIKRNINNGVDYREIAKKLNRKESSVSWICSQIRTGKRKVR